MARSVEPRAKRGGGPWKLLGLLVVAGAAMAGCLLAMIPAVGTVVSAYRWENTSTGEFHDLAQRSTVVDATGNLLGRLGELDRQDVTLDQVPTILQNAVIAVEDQTFWANRGIDVNGILRAVQVNADSGDIREGGSTITQQLVKNQLLTSTRDLDRKVREIALALRLNAHYSKRQILEQYLNTVYFGSGAYGVQAAVERFFLTPGPNGIPVVEQLKDVTIGQAALLAGLVSNPAGYDPFGRPVAARARRSTALGRMVEQGYITQAQSDAAELEPLPTIRPAAGLRPANAWVAEIQNRIVNDPMFVALGATPTEREKRLLTGGLRVVAQLDPATQAAAAQAMEDVLPATPGFTGALVAIDPRTGAVKAMVSGPGFEHSQYNIATSFPGRQAGSTWKTITLAAALENGFSPNDVVDGTSPCAFPAPIGATQNFEPGGGVMTLRRATVGSVNCAYARTELAVGLGRVVATAHKLGVVQRTLQPILTLTLGTIETAPLEMATVAATIANGGVHHTPTFVSKIVGPDGAVLFDATNQPGDRAISAETAACETDVLRNVVTSGTGTNANVPGRPVAGKTGTTDGLADANFLGFTPQLAVFIWYGNGSGRVPGAGFGGDVPARVFRQFVTNALAGQPAVAFPDPGPTCARPGALVSEAGRGL